MRAPVVPGPAAAVLRGKARRRRRPELLKVQGSVTFHAPDGANYRVVTGADGDRGARYFVGGDRFDALEAAHPIVKGVPEIWQSPEQAVVSRVVPRRIRIRHALRGGGPWTELDTGRFPFGLLRARIEDREGNASFLRFARVPAVARIERSACGNGRGIIACATATKAGLKVECVLDERTYEKGIKVSDAEMRTLNITGDAFHPEWNYTIKPRES